MEPGFSLFAVICQRENRPENEEETLLNVWQLELFNESSDVVFAKNPSLHLMKM